MSTSFKCSDAATIGEILPGQNLDEDPWLPNLLTSVSTLPGAGYMCCTLRVSKAATTFVADARPRCYERTVDSVFPAPLCKHDRVDKTDFVPFLAACKKSSELKKQAAAKTLSRWYRERRVSQQLADRLGQNERTVQFSEDMSDDGTTSECTVTSSVFAAIKDLETSSESSADIQSEASLEEILQIPRGMPPKWQWPLWCLNHKNPEIEVFVMDKASGGKWCKAEPRSRVLDANNCDAYLCAEYRWKGEIYVQDFGPHQVRRRGQQLTVFQMFDKTADGATDVFMSRAHPLNGLASCEFTTVNSDDSEEPSEGHKRHVFRNKMTTMMGRFMISRMNSRRR